MDCGVPAEFVVDSVLRGRGVLVDIKVSVGLKD